MKKLILLLLLSFPIQAQTLLSLDDCIRTALQQHPDIMIQNLKITKAAGDVELAKKSRWPSLSASFSGGLNGGRSIDPFSNSFVQTTVNYNSMGLSGGINLFNGFALQTQIAQKKAGHESEIIQLDLIKKETQMAVIEAFMRVVLAEKLIKMHQESGQDLLTQKTAVQERVKEGLKANYELVEIEAQIAANQFDITNAMNDLKLAKSLLAQLMVYKGKFEIKTPQLDIVPVSPARPNLNFQPGLRIFDKQIEMAKLNQNLVKAEKYPHLLLNLGFGSSYSSAAASEFSYFSQLGYNFNQYLGLSMSWPLANQVRDKLKSAKIEEKIFSEQKEKQTLQMKQQIESMELEISSLNEKIKSSGTNVKAQEKLYSGAKEKYTEGLINNLELNTYRLNLEKARIQLLQNQIEHYFKVVLLNTFLL